MHVDN